MLMEDDVRMRPIDKSIVLSLNLKCADNFDKYMVILVGIEDNQHLFNNLPSMIKHDRVQSFDDIEKSLTFIHSQSDINIFVIISGTLGEIFASKLIAEPQIIGLYIYCKNENHHTNWSEEIKKIRYVSSNPTQLIIQLHNDIKKFSNRWPFEEKSFEKATTSLSQWYHLFLLVICYRSKSLVLSYHNMFKECREYYADNSSMRKQIDRFSQEFQPTDAIKEYTGDSFVYRIVNHALRTQNMKLIRIFSPFIRDLHSQIYDLHKKYYGSPDKKFIRSIYRGQNLSVGQLNHLISVWKSKSPIITLSTFGSTSLDPEIALNFATTADGLISCLFEIVITDTYNDEKEGMNRHAQVFADISRLSIMGYEQEVLFSLVTHFRIEYIEYRQNQSERPWILIVLELITDEERGRRFSDADVIKQIERIEDLQVYNDILDMLEKTAEDEIKFNNTNWSIWWNTLNRRWKEVIANKQPLNFIFYDCFTNNKYWSRKAINMHKIILRSIPSIESSRLSFDKLSKEVLIWNRDPAKWLAFFEEYLEALCTENTEKNVKLFETAGQMYEKIADKKLAEKYYDKALALNTDDKYNRNKTIQDKKAKLQKPSRSSPTATYDRRLILEDHAEDVSEVYEMHNRPQELYRTVKACSVDTSSIDKCLTKIYALLGYVEEWHDTVDCRIILCLPFEENTDLSVNDYRVNFFLAMKRHLTLTMNGANNHSLSLWRYKKYMHEWVFINQLKQCLLPHRTKSKSINNAILPKIDRLLKKLCVLIAICTIYISIDSISDQVDVNNIPFINVINTDTRQHIFSHLHTMDLLTGLKTFKIDDSINSNRYLSFPDHWRRAPTVIDDFSPPSSVLI